MTLETFRLKKKLYLRKLFTDSKRDVLAKISFVLIVHFLCNKKNSSLIESIQTVGFPSDQRCVEDRLFDQRMMDVSH